MFQDRAMYWFSDAEKVELNSEVFSVKPAVRKKLSTYVIEDTKKRKLKEKENPSLTTKEIVQLIQKRLNEIGCNAGYADGIWGKKQKRQQLDLQEKQGCQHQSMN